MILPVSVLDRHHLVLAVPGVEDRQDRLAGMHGDLHRADRPAASAGRPA